MQKLRTASILSPPSSPLHQPPTKREVRPEPPTEPPPRQRLDSNLPPQQRPTPPPLQTPLPPQPHRRQPPPSTLDHLAGRSQSQTSSSSIPSKPLPIITMTKSWKSPTPFPPRESSLLPTTRRRRRTERRLSTHFRSNRRQPMRRTSSPPPTRLPSRNPSTPDRRWITARRRNQRARSRFWVLSPMPPIITTRKPFSDDPFQKRKSPFPPLQILRWTLPFSPALNTTMQKSLSQNRFPSWPSASSRRRNLKSKRKLRQQPLIQMDLLELTEGLWNMALIRRRWM